MAEFEAIKNQLQSFIRKYQLNLLIKGFALFVLFGLLFFLIILVGENYIWFSSNIRFILFLSFILVETGLLIFLIGLPLFKVLNLNSAISDKEAAVRIGEYFPEIDDRLLNLIELKKQGNSEFLEAAIRQKSAELKFYKFSNAVNFGEFRNYMLAAFIPILLILAFIISGRGEWLFNSFKRIKNYDQVYEKPAPFSFVLNVDDLEVIEGDDFLLAVEVLGNEIPENVKILVGDDAYFMKQSAPGHFSYVFKNLSENQEFTLKSNNISSKTYNLKVVPVPKLINFSIDIVYPDYLKRDPDRITGDGNLSVPEGTSLKWNFEHRNTNVVNLQFPDTLLEVQREYRNAFNQSTDYRISTSNSYLKYYEPLSFQLQIIKDKSPSIEVEEKIDSLDISKKLYAGKLSDDYGISNLLLRYRKVGEDKFNAKPIYFNKGTVSRFYASFPGELQLQEGSNYEYFFQVFDNDAVNGVKSSSSQYFTYYKNTSEEINDQNLQDQEENIDNLSKELDKFKQEDRLNNLLNDELENKEFNYEQKQKLESFIKSQERENESMEKFSKNFKDKLDSADPKDDDANHLKERLENAEEKLKDNKKLLDELKEYSDKIENDNLQRKLENLSKNKNASKRSLEQLVELTKQYYVEQKYNQLVDKLDNLGNEQKELDKIGKSQEDINDKFDEIQKELNQLDKKNRELKRPKSLKRDKQAEKEIEQDLENLNSDDEKSDDSNKKSDQQKVGQKMKDLAEKMKRNSANMEMQTLKGDIEALRKVLDNLVIFSFEQEKLMNEFAEISTDNPGFSSNLKEQYVLKENFEHIDDSLFTLGLNNEFIAEKVFEFLERVSFNLNNSLKELADVRLSKAISSQQYTITGANDLAVLLDDILKNMNQQMNSSGSGGEGSGPQLQDIIQKQKELGEQMMQQMGDKKNETQQQTEEGEQSKLFEIYKQQEQIRKNLQKILKENGMDLQELNEDYDKLEKDILNNEIHQNSLQTLDRIHQKMLDLKQSLNEKGEREERESETNMRDFDNQSSKVDIDIKDYFNTIEILDRQALPLRPNLKQRVNTYFND
ncbi:hypothetical protein [Zunongwangia pacifica]|uniref:ATPase n=1 Tax=Zunongwangia pacifica TaxID=2911062 RepID=A0A9X2CIV0_9FLAO|nr:hypothetical protein [Zunongwangia pacifica]MCL6217096.1 hypothetical protein [Zunongwangia pacifica]